MKKLVYLLATIIVFASCNNNAENNTRTPGDTLNQLPDTTMNRDTLYRQDTP
ncbi:MAG TPA: hypothetical protein VHM26_08395 [Chitinophagaceae bacterium]|jgi:uncharacterized lipoprotein YajG|nr:hypothetical protein [Chitinophagaceae bacterium]